MNIENDGQSDYINQGVSGLPLGGNQALNVNGQPSERQLLLQTLKQNKQLKSKMEQCEHRNGMLRVENYELKTEKTLEAQKSSEKIVQLQHMFLENSISYNEEIDSASLKLTSLERQNSHIKSENNDLRNFLGIAQSRVGYEQEQRIKAQQRYKAQHNSCIFLEKELFHWKYRQNSGHHVTKRPFSERKFRKIEWQE